MAKNVRFGEYVQAVSVDTASVTYGDVLPKPQFDAQGREIPQKITKLNMSGSDIVNLLQPYLSTRFMEQVTAVVPLAVFLAVFQWLVLQKSVADATLIGTGLLAVMIGLMIFMEGLKLGLMPFGDIIGSNLPRKLWQAESDLRVRAVRLQRIRRRPA